MTATELAQQLEDTHMFYVGGNTQAEVMQLIESLQAIHSAMVAENLDILPDLDES